MGYTPRAEIFDVTTSIPTVALRMEIWKKARRIADEMIIKAQKRWAQSKNPPRTYQDGDLVWLEGRNLHLDRPTVKLAPKRHGPFMLQSFFRPTTRRYIGLLSFFSPPSSHRAPVLLRSYLVDAILSCCLLLCMICIWCCDTISHVRYISTSHSYDY